MKNSIVSALILSLFFQPLVWAHEPASFSLESAQAETSFFQNPSSLQPVTGPAAESHLFLGGGSPLSAVKAQTPFLTGLFSAELPPEGTFVTRLSNGHYEVSVDAYMRALRDEVMPDSATQNFEALELVNVELQLLFQRTLESLASQYDFVVMLPTESARAQFESLQYASSVGVMGLGSAVRDDIQGIGENTGDEVLLQELNDTFGPLFTDNFSYFMEEVNARSQLQGISWVDLDAVAEHGLDTAQYKRMVALHEIAHRWGMRLSATASNANPLGILGRDGSHWSPYLDAGLSPMDGVDWRDNGDGTFTLQHLQGIPFSGLISGNYSGQTNQFSDLDLYAMGLITAGEISNTFVIQNPQTMGGAALTEENFSTLFQDPNFLLNPTIRGSRRTVTGQDIVNLNGLRVPNIAESQKNFSVAFITLKSGSETSTVLTNHRNQVTSLAGSVTSYWQSATRNLSTLTLGPASGAFTAFTNHVNSAYDSLIASIQQRKAAALSAEESKGSLHQSKINTLQSRVTQIENLLAPLNARAQSEPAFAQALGTIPQQVAQLKQSIQQASSLLSGQFSAANGVRSNVTTFRSDLQVLLNAAASSGVLPLGFGAGRDAAIDLIDTRYSEVTSSFSSLNNSLNTNLPDFETQLNQILAKVNTDTTAPSGSIQINSGASQIAGSFNTAITFTDSQLGPAYMRRSYDGGQTWTNFQAYSANWQFTDYQSQGTNYRLLIQVCDFFWNCSSADDQILFNYNDTVVPSGGFTINNGAATTSTGQLQLNLNFQDTGSQLFGTRVSTDFGETWTNWTKNSTVTMEAWPSNGTNYGIWVQACDNAWNCKTEFKSILYQYQDSVPPSGTLLINGGAATASGDSMTLNLDFFDDATRVGQMRYSTNRGQSWSDFRSYTSILEILGLSPEVTVQVCDVAWNCASASDTIQVV